MWSNGMIAISSLVHQTWTLVEEVAQYAVNDEETNGYFESLLNNFHVELDRCLMVNRDAKAEYERLTVELEQYKGQQTFFEYNQQKYNELEIGYRSSVYEEQCLAQMLNDLTRSSKKTINFLNAEMSDLKNQLLNRESAYSDLVKDKDKLKIKLSKCEDELDV
ncbi:hypothetical protein Tco_0264114 [Tanacetum coccineum]